MIIKTNWKTSYSSSGAYLGDYFNIEDYERIRLNLVELKNLVLMMYPSCPVVEMVSKSYKDYFYAEDINRFENNLETIVSSSFPFPIGKKRTFKANDPFLNFSELNRIEAGIELLYQQLTGQYQGAKRLSFTCGGGHIAC